MNKALLFFHCWNIFSFSAGSLTFFSFSLMMMPCVKGSAVRGQLRPHLSLTLFSLSFSFIALSFLFPSLSLSSLHRNTFFFFQDYFFVLVRLVTLGPDPPEGPRPQNSLEINSKATILLFIHFLRIISLFIFMGSSFNAHFLSQKYPEVP